MNEDQLSFTNLAVWQSQVHLVWMQREMMRTRLVLNPYGCDDFIKYFPGPYDWDAYDARLATVFLRLTASQALIIKQFMARPFERCHDPNDNSPEVVRVRELLVELDQAVLDAYHGMFDDIDNTRVFVEQPDGSFSWRWPDEVRDEVLLRLDELAHTLRLGREAKRAMERNHDI